MTTAPTPEEVQALAARLEHCVAKWGKQNALSLEAYSAVKMMRRLQAEIDRLLAQVHKLEMDALDLASENSILKRAETEELEARKPLPLSIERLDELWASQRSFHGGEPLKMGHVEFARLIEVEYGVLGRIPMREENGGQIDPALVDKSPNLQEPQVDKTENLQDLPAALSDDDQLRLRSDVARAIWDVMREHEDRCGHALEDVEPKHQVWDCADAAIKAVHGITGGSS